MKRRGPLLLTWEGRSPCQGNPSIRGTGRTNLQTQPGEDSPPILMLKIDSNISNDCWYVVSVAVVLHTGNHSSTSKQC